MISAWAPRKSSKKRNKRITRFKSQYWGNKAITDKEINTAPISQKV
jgi:hypothetical protein